MIKRLPLVEQVADELSRRIALMDRNESADRMLPSERELARQTGVSRPVLREAIRRLETQGLVEVKHGVGVLAVNQPHRPIAGTFSRVAPVGRAKLLQYAEARLVIEPGVARLAAIRSTPASTAKLRAIHQKLATLSDSTSSVDAAVELDLAFHRALADVAGNKVLGTVLDALADLGRESRELTIAASGTALPIRQHAAILDAVAARNPDEAGAAMQLHLEQASIDIQQQIKPLSKPLSKSTRSSKRSIESDRETTTP